MPRGRAGVGEQAPRTTGLGRPDSTSGHVRPHRSPATPRYVTAVVVRSAPSSLEIGTLLAGKWELVATVASGGLATVYEARHRNGLVVAIKRLHPRFLHDARIVERFAREASLANRVPHPSIVKVLDDGIDDHGCPFLVLEWAAGHTVEEMRVANGGTLPWGEVVKLGDQLLVALASAHGARVVHRDVKPANIVVDETKRLRLLDFGLSRAFEDDSAEDALTSVDTVLGTVGFMSPEQAGGRWDLVDERSDLWSTAATLWKVATGQDVHEGETKLSRLAVAAVVPVNNLADRSTGLAADVLTFFDRALAFGQRDRFQTADDMRHALLALSPPASNFATPYPAPRSARRLAQVSVAAVVLLIAGYLAYRSPVPPIATPRPALVSSVSLTIEPGPPQGEPSRSSESTPPTATPKRLAAPTLLSGPKVAAPVKSASPLSAKGDPLDKQR